jgi:hypothetical protein
MSPTRQRPRNPFTTRFIRPGSLAPRDAEGNPLDVAAIVGRLADLGGTAAIEGPHGSGKTTLLVAVAESLATTGRLAGMVRLRAWGDGVRAVRLVSRAAAGTMVLVDSWERMGPVAARVALWSARRRGCGLLVTSHRPTGLPVLVQGRTSVALLERLVAALPNHGGLIAADDIAAAHATHDGNLREALLDLYDRFECRAR